MANHKSAIKRIRQSSNKRLSNRYFHKTTRNAVSKIRGLSKKKEAMALLPKVEAMIDKLTKRMREEERQKQSAVQYAENVRSENEDLKKRLEQLDKGFQEEFDTRVTTQIQSAKQLLKEAHETGDVDKIVDVQEVFALRMYSTEIDYRA